jgi:hypothetical protein
MVEKLHQMSQYLGDEVVVVGVKQANNPWLCDQSPMCRRAASTIF